jgi:hypothetical protein
MNHAFDSSLDALIQMIIDCRGQSLGIFETRQDKHDWKMQ